MSALIHRTSAPRSSHAKPAPVEEDGRAVQIYHDGRTRPYTKADLRDLVSSICVRKNLIVDTSVLVEKVYRSLKDVNQSNEILGQIVSVSADMAPLHYEYPEIASSIVVNQLHQNTHNDYLRVVEALHRNVNSNGDPAPIISDSFLQFVRENQEAINQMLDYSRDYSNQYFGFRTLEKSYLKRTSCGRIVERPQHFCMRVAISFHYRMEERYNNRDFSLKVPLSKKECLEKIRVVYDRFSQGYFTHATPTLFNAGTRFEQDSSCFLFGCGDDMHAIGKCWKDAAVISKHTGGIGIHLSNVRYDGAYIASTGGRASGMRLLKVFNEIAQYADQGGKRAGSIAIYLEPWHADIFFFLELRNSTGAETERTRDLFMGLMVNDLFMCRVRDDMKWSLMCPNSCPNIVGKYGQEFVDAYEQYEAEGRYIRQVDARAVWELIQSSHFNAGTPYLINKDAVNYKSNQINIGVVNGSNLCAEIVEYSDEKQYAVCNLASICLPRFVKQTSEGPVFDYQDLMEVSRIVCENLNNIIDINYYPLPETRYTNENYRPIGIGAQGLADVFALMKTPFDSPLARELNRKIFETIYYGAMRASIDLAKKEGPYNFFAGSPFSQGKFQFDLWDEEQRLHPRDAKLPASLPKTPIVTELSGMWDWESLREEMVTYGTRNSLLTACMPTATTSQIMGNNETTEPYTQNIYTRSTLAGEFYVVNQHMMKDLMAAGYWSEKVMDMIKVCEGSITPIKFIPENIRSIYRTAWEISKMSILEMAAERGRFVDQTQSMNLFLPAADHETANTLLFYGWELGLKTMIYYMRTKAGVDPIQFGIDAEKAAEYRKELERAGDQICRFVPKSQRKDNVCFSCDG